MKQALCHYNQARCIANDTSFATIDNPIPARVIEHIRLWQQRVNTRKQLARLNADQLADIGIDSAAAQREISKPFWEK